MLCEDAVYGCGVARLASIALVLRRALHVNDQSMQTGTRPDQNKGTMIVNQVPFQKIHFDHFAAPFPVSVTRQLVSFSRPC